MEKRYIPENTMSNKRILGFQKRNFTEALIEMFIVFLILGVIPFVVKVRWIFFFCLSGGILLVNYIGVQGTALTKALGQYISYKRLARHIFSYRRFSNDTSRGNKKLIVNGKVKILRQAETTRRIKTIIGI